LLNDPLERQEDPVIETRAILAIEPRQRDARQAAIHMRKYILATPGVQRFEYYMSEQGDRKLVVEDWDDSDALLDDMVALADEQPEELQNILALVTILEDQILGRLSSDLRSKLEALAAGGDGRPARPLTIYTNILDSEE
jgi:hypothetical protein